MSMPSGDVAPTRSSTRATHSALDMTSHTPSHASSTKRSVRSRAVHLTSGSAETGCFEGGSSATHLWRKSPSARDRERSPLTRLGSAADQGSALADAARERRWLPRGGSVGLQPSLPARAFASGSGLGSGSGFGSLPARASASASNAGHPSTTKPPACRMRCRSTELRGLWSREVAPRRRGRAPG